MKKQRVIVSTLWILTLAPGLAAAQPVEWRPVGAQPQAPERTELQVAPAGARERAYADGFAGADATAQVRRVRFVWNPTGEGLLGDLDVPAPPATDRTDGHLRRVHGVEVRVGDGELEVVRLRFRSSDMALAFAANSESVFDPDGGTRIVEVRGEQVLVLSGDRLDDPTYAASARRAGWGQLPVRGESALLAVTRGKEAFSARTGPSGPLHEAVSGTYERAGQSRAALEDPESSLRGEWSDDAVRIWGARFTSTLGSSDAGSYAALVIGEGHAEREAELREHLAAVEEAMDRGAPGQAAERRERAGAADRLEALFGR